MKKKYLILAGLLVLTVAATGCGKKQEETQTPKAEATATPTPEVTKAVDLVNMQQSSDETDIKNVMGEKTATASKVVFVNKTGDDIASVYIRSHIEEDGEDEDEDTWGTDLINGMFTLKDQDKALYYFENNNNNNTNKSVQSYDIRVTYTDEDASECFFRDIPLGTISQISLCMDGTGEDAIPYATYLTGTAKKEISTLSDVKKRLGLDDEDSSDASAAGSQDASGTPTPTPSSDSNSGNTNNNSNNDNTNNNSNSNSGNNGQNDEPAPTEAPTDEDPNDPGDNSGDSDMSSVAKQYIGQSLDDLESACGSAQGSDYEDDPETGKSGFHYYSNFTVSTTVDENGNEIVTGVW